MSLWRKVRRRGERGQNEVSEDPNWLNDGLEGFEDD